MESLSWLKNFVEGRVRPTQKLYYDRYGYRLELRVPNARWLNLSRGSVIGPITLVESQLLGVISAIKRSKDNPDIRLRTEGNCVQIYTKTAPRLKKIVEQIVSKIGVKAAKNYVNHLNAPTDPAVLTAGVRLVDCPDFKYQVRIKTDRRTRRNHAQIRQYLENLGPGMARIFCSNEEMTVRLNDLTALNFLDLISPGCVGKIYELVQRLR